MSLTLIDLFCGAGGSSQGMTAVPGVDLRLGANHWRLAVESHAANFRDADHVCADVSQIDPRRWPSADLLWASPECFPAGTLVLTDRGLIPIEWVKVGDQALTHKGRWRKVVRTQSKIADRTVVVKGQGMTAGIEVTPNHSFWARPSLRVWDNSVRQYKRRWEDPDWHKAETLGDGQAYWGTPLLNEDIALDMPGYAHGFGADPTSSWWLIGRWLGDGTLGLGEQHSDVTITCGFHEAQALGEMLALTGAEWRRRHLRTAVAFTLPDRKTRDWLLTHFAHGSAHKTIPAWALTMPRDYRQALLHGYVSADGNVGPRRTQIDTVSQKLALSIKLLAESLGHRAGVYKYQQCDNPIEGRTVNLQPFIWKVTWENADGGRLEAFAEEGIAWSRVRSVEDGRRDVEVFNLEVEEDHSYVANGIIVRNCTNHTTAKNHQQAREALTLFDPDKEAERSRATMWDVPRFAEAHQYKGVIVENVVEARSWKQFDAWLMAMTAEGYEHRIVYWNSGFQPWGQQLWSAPAPQSRDRMYTVFWKRGVKAPELDVPVSAWCSSCEETVPAQQRWKSTFEQKLTEATRRRGSRPDRMRWGLFRSQYDFRCDQCGSPAEPWMPAALNALDLSIPAQRIGDRATPLAENTLRRIRKGLQKYRGRDLIIPLDHGASAKMPRAADLEPMFTQTARATTMFTQTARATTMLVKVAGHTFEREHSTCRTQGTDEPMKTISARGFHHLLTIPGRVMLVRNNGDGRDSGWATTDAHGEPMRTLTTKGHQSVLIDTWHGKSEPRPASEPLTTQHTRDTHGVIKAAASSSSTVTDEDVEACLYRMLEPSEILRGMAFREGYRVLGNRRQQTAQAGNAVTPPAAEVLGRALVEALDG